MTNTMTGIYMYYHFTQLSPAAGTFLCFLFLRVCARMNGFPDMISVFVEISGSQDGVLMG